MPCLEPVDDSRRPGGIHSQALREEQVRGPLRVGTGTAYL